MSSGTRHTCRQNTHDKNGSALWRYTGYQNRKKWVGLRCLLVRLWQAGCSRTTYHSTSLRLGALAPEVTSKECVRWASMLDATGMSLSVTGCFVTVPQWVNYFSVAMIKYREQKQLGEERVYFSLCEVLEDGAHHVGRVRHWAESW